MEKKLIYSEVKYDWKKCDEGKMSHPFISFNGGYNLTNEDRKECGSRNYPLANLFMQSDKPFILRESGFSGNLNGIICRLDDYNELFSELDELKKQEENEWQTRIGIHDNKTI